MNQRPIFTDEDLRKLLQAVLHREEVHFHEHALAVGKMLYGFCNGFFGRDSYGDKRVEAFGHDWIVVREEGGRPNFCYFEDGWLDQKDELIAEWSKREDGGE